MDVLAAITNVIESFYPKERQDYCAMDAQTQADKDRTDRIRLMAVLMVTVARRYKKRQGETPIAVDPKKGYVENFVHMMYGDTRPGQATEAELTEIFNKLFILHADHEQNCSTSTVRMVASSKADPYAAIAAGINALSGPAHGGANQDVMANLRKIRQEASSSSVNEVLDEQIRKALLPGDQKVMIPGIGHRVYKFKDPRAEALKLACDKYLDKLKPANKELLEIAQNLEGKVNTDDFRKKGLYPNVDFYSGILYDALGLPEDMFTTMFALGRLPGWLAHMQEQQNLAGGRSKVKIYRPRQVYTGATERHLPAEK
jgi:citrate synthase